MPFIPVSGVRSNISSSESSTKTNLGLAVFVMLLVNPPFGLLAVIFALWAKKRSATDWSGAVVRGKISFCLSVAGIVITVIVVLVLVLVFFSRDS